MGIGWAANAAQDLGMREFWQWVQVEGSEILGGGRVWNFLRKIDNRETLREGDERTFWLAGLIAYFLFCTFDHMRYLT